MAFVVDAAHAMPKRGAGDTACLLRSEGYAFVFSSSPSLRRPVRAEVSAVALISMEAVPSAHV